jgi:hypothetical protein
MLFLSAPTPPICTLLRVTSIEPGAVDGLMRLHEIVIDVQIGEVAWSGWHTWRDRISTWVDGTFVVGGSRATQLDIGCFGDGCCVPPEVHQRATDAWKQGSVYSFIPFENAPRALVIPEMSLCTETITEAIRRFSP